MNKVFINSLGVFLPGDPISNMDMENYLGFIGGKPSRYRALVLRQNKIKTRHYALLHDGSARHSNAGMAALAIKNAVERSEILLNDVSYMACATSMGDVLLPGIASNIHGELKMPPLEIASFQSVCASAMMAIKSAYLQIKSGEHPCAVVSGSEFASRYFRPGFYECTTECETTGTVPLNADFLRFTLSDGAGAAVFESKPNTKQLSLEIKWVDIRSYADRFYASMVGGGVPEKDGIKFWGNYGNPIKAAQAGAFMLTQDFDLMRQMIPAWISHYLDLIEQGKIGTNIDHVCSHFSAHSLKDEAFVLLKKTGAMIPEEKWFSNLSSKGNTGTASLFIMLEQLCRDRELKKGQNILCHVPESGRALNGFMLLEVV